MKHYRQFLLLLAMLSAATFASAQETHVIEWEKRRISSFVITITELTVCKTQMIQQWRLP